MSDRDEKAESGAPVMPRAVLLIDPLKPSRDKGAAVLDALGLVPRVAADAFEFLAHHSSSLWNARTASSRPMVAKITMNSACSHSTSIPTPLRNTPRVTTRK